MATLQLIEAIQAGLVVPSTGAALASGKCRFYDVSTLTPQTVFSDSAGATPITQPLTLTAGGTGTVYTASPCRCIVKSADDLTTLYDIAVVNGVVPASMFITSSSFNGGTQTTLQTIMDAVDDSFGGRDWKYKIGTSERNIKDTLGAISLMPQDYGALGDGVTDDTSAFTALAAAQAATGRPIFIPQALYQLSSVITFSANGAIVRGAGRGNLSTSPPTGGTVLRGTNGTMDLLKFTGESPVLENMTLTHSTSSTGRAVLFQPAGASAGYVNNVAVTLTSYTTGFSTLSSGGATAVNCNIRGSTDATVGSWSLNTCLTAGTLSATTKFTAQTLSQTGLLYATATADMANGGNTTPSIGGTGQLIAFQRIRGTSAGGGTVNASSIPNDTKVLILDLFNNSGGAYTFTLNAQYHGTGNPAPANGTRRLVAYAWEPTSGVWEEFARSAADVT